MLRNILVIFVQMVMEVVQMSIEILEQNCMSQIMMVFMFIMVVVFFLDCRHGFSNSILLVHQSQDQVDEFIIGFVRLGRYTSSVIIPRGSVTISGAAVRIPQAKFRFSNTGS